MYGCGLEVPMNRELAEKLHAISENPPKVFAGEALVEMNHLERCGYVIRHTESDGSFKFTLTALGFFTMDRLIFT